CVHRALSSHSASSSSPCVVVGNRRTSRFTFPCVTRRRQTTTSVLCTSTPAHLLCNVFIATSSKCGRREALAIFKLYLACSRMRSPLSRQRQPLTTITGAQRASGQTHSRVR